MSETQVKPRRRWSQFRLATLMMAVTISAVVCALLPWQLSVFLLAAFPALHATLLAISRGMAITRGQLAALAIAWLVFYPVSVGPVATFAVILFRTNESFVAALGVFYFPLVWATNAFGIEPIVEYVEYWEQVGQWIGELPELNVGQGRI